MSSKNINKWFQDGPPVSYKIQISYVDIPKNITLQKKNVDTPFRFRNYEEAARAASEMFKGYETTVIGSSDEPHWQAPETRMREDELKEQNWYDVYGVTPSYQVDYNQRKAKSLQKTQQREEFKDLKQLKPQPKV
jgi:hypothetical protein